MKTVSQLKNYYSLYSWLNYDFNHGNWGLAQKIEDKDFVVQKVYGSGLIRVNLPDWYKLKPDNTKLMKRIVDTGISFSYISIGQYSFTVKE